MATNAIDTTILPDAQQSTVAVYEQFGFIVCGWYGDAEVELVDDDGATVQVTRDGASFGADAGRVDRLDSAWLIDERDLTGLQD